MKKNISLAVLFVFILTQTTAQNTVLGRIVYDYSFVQDPKNPQNIYEDILVLQFNKTSSVFRSQLLIESTEREKKRMKEVFQNSDGKTIIDNGVSPIKGTPVRYYNFYTEKMDYQYTFSNGTRFLVKEPLEHINWKILHELRGIAGFGCQKAIGRSHGRTYIAWFSTDIPYPYGPRKLWGLPGMILEAHDIENHIIYKLNTVDLNPMPGEIIALPKDGVLTTSKEFSKMQSAIANGASSGNKMANSDGITAEQLGSNRRPPAAKWNLNPIDRE